MNVVKFQSYLSDGCIISLCLLIVYLCILALWDYRKMILMQVICFFICLMDLFTLCTVSPLKFSHPLGKRIYILLNCYNLHFPGTSSRMISHKTYKSFFFHFCGLTKSTMMLLECLEDALNSMLIRRHGICSLTFIWVLLTLVAK